jgi:seryl-tRNA synthetase
MLDINFIVKNRDIVMQQMQKRMITVDIDAIITAHNIFTTSNQQMQELQAKRNKISEDIARIKSGKGENLVEENLKNQAQIVNSQLEEVKIHNSSNEQRLHDLLAFVPNILDDTVPTGTTEEQNIEIKQYGIKPVINFLPKEHDEIGHKLSMMDFETAVKISGSRFVVLRSDLATMERALASMMIQSHVEHFGYMEYRVPLLVNNKAMFGTGQLPKFDNGFITQDGRYLIPTAEVPLTNLVADQMLAEEELPLRFTAQSQCFRSEAGAAGRDTKGMIRQHQFSKVELVSIATPQQSKDEHERMLAAAEAILQKLNLHYKIMLLCSGDTGFCSQKTYDIEVWLPGQNKYREISSCSNAGTFQARRMKTKYKTKVGKKDFVHTLNGSGLAIGRTMIAILENYQNADGSVEIPNILQPYLGGKTKILPIK